MKSRTSIDFLPEVERLSTLYKLLIEVLLTFQRLFTDFPPTFYHIAFCKK